MFDVVLIGKRYAHLYNKNVTIISFDQLVLIYMHHRIYMHQSALYISLFFFCFVFFGTHIMIVYQRQEYRTLLNYYIMK